MNTDHYNCPVEKSRPPKTTIPTLEPWEGDMRYPDEARQDAIASMRGCPARFEQLDVYDDDLRTKTLFLPADLMRAAALHLRERFPPGHMHACGRYLSNLAYDEPAFVELLDHLGYRVRRGYRIRDAGAVASRLSEAWMNQVAVRDVSGLPYQPLP